MAQLTTQPFRIQASAPVQRPAAEVFDVLSRPASFVDLGGDGSVRATTFGPEQLSAVGQRFGTRMRMFGVPYRITSRVVTFEPGRVVAFRHPLGHHWRWEVRPIAPDRCEVIETYDLRPSRWRRVIAAMGYLEKQRSNVEASVDNVANHLEQGRP